MNLGSNRCCNNNLNKNIVGPQGAIGHFGPIGAIGNTGFTGSTGFTGATGICYRGYKGDIGPRGPQGGITGPQGSIGPVGANGTALNIKFSFDTNSTASYNTVFTNLNNLAIGPLIDTITLDDGKYSLSWEITENWVDNQNRLYIRFIDVLTDFIPYVNNFNNARYVVLKRDPTKMTGIQNDFIDIVNNSPPNTRVYRVEIWQSTTSGTPVIISNKTVKFNLTLVKLP